MLWVDTNRESANMGITTLVDETVRHCRDSEDTGTRGEEVAGVIVGVESEKVTSEDAEKDFSTDGKNSTRTITSVPLARENQISH